VTPEKLAELEALEAAATVEPWEAEDDCDVVADSIQIPMTYEDGTEVEPGLTYSMRVVSLPYGREGTWPRHNAALICALRNNARDLFAALREAWRERDGSRDGRYKLGEDVRHYRNLAIVLGAKPDQMLNKFDRELCEQGIDPTNTSGGYHISWNDEMEDLRELWEVNDTLTKERDEARAALKMLLADIKAMVLTDETCAAVKAVLGEK
jgi:hypothetical protein